MSSSVRDPRAPSSSSSCSPSRTRIEAARKLYDSRRLPLVRHRAARDPRRGRSISPRTTWCVSSCRRRGSSDCASISPLAARPGATPSPPPLSVSLDDPSLQLSDHHSFRAWRAQARRRALAKRRACKRPLVVTDRGIAALAAARGLPRELSGLDVAVYSDICGQSGAKPGRRTAREAYQGASRRRGDRAGRRRGARRRQGHRADGATHPGDMLEYAWDHPQVRPIDGRAPLLRRAAHDRRAPGSEVGRSSVVSDDATHVKKIIFSPQLLAKAVFADPELTLDLPPAITAATGHGRADAQRRIVPVAGLPSAVRRHRARRRAHRRPRAAARGARRPRISQRAATC